MGVVYRVTDPLHPERRVALKSILRGLIRPEVVGRFKAEFRALTSLKHPNVAEAYDFESLPGTDDHYFTMEYVSGRDLLSATEGEAWPRIVDYLVEVCRALSYVHSRKLIHYDIKPRNVLVSEAGPGGRNLVKVLDFGLAAARSIGPQGWCGGTPAYMAAELADAEAFVDHRADLYSVGIMAYQLLCRRLPFRSDSLPELLRLHRFEPLAFDEPEWRDLPDWLWSVIERLGAKHPADRYPTANAVIEDLNRQEGLTYELETVETREGYVFSSRFVGRKLEYGLICDFVARRTRGSAGYPPMLTVSGESGCGKSRLLREARRDAQLSRTLFCRGRCFEGSFSELQPLVPTLELLTRHAEALGGQDLVREHGPELAKICPSLQMLYGIEPSTPLEQIHRERVRLQEAMCDFLMSFAGQAPYVIYVDDLQWALAGLTDLLAELGRRIAIAERRGEPVPIALLGAFRDDEVQGRPLETMRDIMRSGGRLEEIRLDPLGVTEVGEMLGSMLGAGEPPDAFVDRIARETAGNPFFVEELMRGLVEHGTVRVAADTWDVHKEIGEIEMPGSVAEVFRRRAKMLDETQHSLLEALAACGRPTGADVLAHASRLDPERTHVALSDLVDRRMVQEVPGPGLSFRLCHDRMREALLGELTADRQASLHLALGRTSEEIYARELEEHIFDIVDHYNAATDLLPELEDRNRVARYNELAGRRAKLSGSYGSAGRYFRTAMALLPPDAWSSDYDRIVAISKALMEVEYLGHDLERAERHWCRHIERARTNLEKAEACIVKVYALCLVGRHREALDVAQEAMPRLGVRYPARPGMLSLLWQVFRTQLALRGKTDEDLQSLGELEDPKKRALLELLLTAAPSAFLTYRENLFAYHAAKGVRLVATSGGTPMAAGMLASYAFIRLQGFGDLTGGHRLAETALRWARRYDEPLATGRTLFQVSLFVFPWTRPLAEIAPLLREGHRQSMRAGDLLFASFNRNVEITQQCMHSESVEATLELIDEYDDFLVRIDNPHTLTEIRALRQMLRQLSGRTREGSSFDDEEFSEARFLRYLAELDDAVPIGFFYAFKQKALFLMGLYDEAYELSRAFGERVTATRGQFVFAEHVFFDFLTLARRLPRAGWRERRRLLRDLGRKRRMMQKWAGVCPENFLHKLLLMEAELARLTGKASRARRLYEESAASARQAGFPLNSTLACELAGRFELERGERTEAERWLHAAREGYARWGAGAKVEVLSQELE